jgi:hypothetical protein
MFFLPQMHEFGSANALANYYSTNIIVSQTIANRHNPMRRQPEAEAQKFVNPWEIAKIPL